MNYVVISGLGLLLGESSVDKRILPGLVDFVSLCLPPSDVNTGSLHRGEQAAQVSRRLVWQLGRSISVLGRPRSPLVVDRIGAWA